MKNQVLISGVAVGEKISKGNIKILESLEEFDKFEKGDILVTLLNNSDWEPLMKISSGIITNRPPKMSCTFVAREMGLNAVVGTNYCTEILKDISKVTIYFADGEEGIIYNGLLDFHIDKFEIK